MLIKTSLAGYLSRCNRTRLDLEVTFVVCSKNRHNVNGAAFFVALLNVGRYYPYSQCVGWIVIVVIT